MENKTLSPSALSTIDDYIRFTIGAAVCSVPYFNNNSAKRRASLSVFVGKGSPREIHEEVESILMMIRTSPGSFTSESLKKILTESGIGIDCSGFAYHILNAECESRGEKSLSSHLKLTQVTGIFSKITAFTNPVRHVGVRTFAHEANSRSITLSEIQPGDIITMLAGPDEKDRNHILVVHEVEYRDVQRAPTANTTPSSSRSIPVKIYYSHSVAYPTDGKYSTGIKQGVIEISDITKPITEARWIENRMEGSDNLMYVRAHKSITDLRRLKWW